MGSLLYNVTARQVIAQTTAGATDLTPNDAGGVVVDTQGFEGVLFVGLLDTVTAAGTVRMYPMHSDSTSTTDLVACTGAAYIAGTTASTTSHDGQTIMLDVHKPQKRYLGVTVDKATQASEIRVLAIPYNSHKNVSHSTGVNCVLDPTLAVSPTT